MCSIFEIVCKFPEASVYHNKKMTGMSSRHDFPKKGQRNLIKSHILFQAIAMTTENASVLSKT